MSATGGTSGSGGERHGGSPSASDERVMSLLAAGIPLSLLMDLADVRGPHSWELVVTEGGSADWLPLALPR